MAFFEGRTPEIIHQCNDKTILVKDRGTNYVCKKVLPSELELYEKLMATNCQQIAKVYGFDFIIEGLWVVQEYVPGVTLERYLQMHGKLDELTTCAIAYDICEALETLHGIGVIHRDLTPKNLIITEDGALKVIDFGISRIEKEGSTTDTELLGTAGFAAPEQYGFSQTSPRSDIYSLGVLINYMRTLHFPKEELEKGALSSVIEKCIMMDEKDRYQNATEVKEELLSVGQFLKTGKKENRKATQKKKKQIPPLTKLNGDPFKNPNALPGFRQDNPLHRIIGSLYYAFALLGFFSAVLSPEETVLKTVIVLVVFILVLFLPIPIIFNYLNWLERIPLTRGRPRGVQGIFQVMLLVLDIILIRFLLGFV